MAELKCYVITWSYNIAICNL